MGNDAGLAVTTADNVICIGAKVAGANVSNSCFIGNIRNVQTQNADAIAVVVDSFILCCSLSVARERPNHAMRRNDNRE